jgi:hypothetical protein
MNRVTFIEIVQARLVYRYINMKRKLNAINVYKLNHTGHIKNSILFILTFLYFDSE